MTEHAAAAVMTVAFIALVAWGCWLIATSSPPSAVYQPRERHMYEWKIETKPVAVRTSRPPQPNRRKKKKKKARRK